ncbi:MAG: GNAT family N-acetyltransferase [Pseudoclavibacter sp.]|nr:GNAT family N-acetyltransferase [Pseudoclavibacter sp.]
MIDAFRPQDRSALLELSLRAWEPVLPRMRQGVPAFVSECFFPRGWRSRQLADLGAVLDGEPENVDVAPLAARPVGWACTRMHVEDSMGELYVLAVDPEFHRRGIARALMDRACDRARQAGMPMVMAETGGDAGHEAARRSYEAAGFRRWPVARYFKDLGE